jgi:hypothetical protein
MIVPTALLVGTLQVLIPSHRGGIGSPEDQRPQVSAPSSPADRAARAPQAEREPQGPPLPAPRPLASGASATDEATAVGSSPIQVLILHAAGARNALPAIQLAAFLQTRGFDVTDIRPVDIEIERPSVRYFFDGDQSESRRLVEALGAFFAEAPDWAPGEAADFSRFAPKPRRGKIEVWLPPPDVGESQST